LFAAATPVGLTQALGPVTKYNVSVERALAGAALLTLAGIAVGVFEQELTAISLIAPYVILFILQTLAFAWSARQNPTHPVRQAIFAGVGSCLLSVTASGLLRVPDAPAATALIDSAVFGLSFLFGVPLAKATNTKHWA